MVQTLAVAVAVIISVSTYIPTEYMSQALAGVEMILRTLSHV